MGNLSKNSTKYLQKRFKRKINHISLPYGNFENISNKFSYKNKNEIISLLYLHQNKNNLLNI